ncbi:uncharacterized protein LOC130138917 [Syzygium oleosum]|uniref:uncharacterized protein LOC130138917 n=1 Tax=Syzygium oleosum TaxID=219896 RepID=UPI0024B9DBD3|nr:uncharacterized protein LOC130138917 [Syzygium oleosum]
MKRLLTQRAALPRVEPPVAPIAVKLDGKNYGVWSQVVEMYVSGKDKLGYLNGDSPEPPPTDPSFRQWKTDDSTRQVSRLKQGGGPIEKYYNDLQGLWREIDFRRPNPMQCPADILRYNAIVHEDRVYTFLDGLDDRLDNVRADVMKMDPFPTIEQAYARVRREDMRQSVVLSTPVEVTSGSAMIGGMIFETKKKKQGSQKGRNGGQASLVTSGLSLIPMETESANAESLEGNCGFVFANGHGDGHHGWIIDSGATDHMTPESGDLLTSTTPRRDHIYNANGYSFPDILTKEIIGRGTKREGLYFVDEITSGRTYHSRGQLAQEKELWLWHRQLGHPSFGWFIIFVDDCARMTWLYLMKHKNEAEAIFRTFHCMIQTQFGAKLQVLRSDNGGEYLSKPLATYFQEHGLIHETSCPQTPQQNGVAERKNRHLLEPLEHSWRVAMFPIVFGILP